MVSQLMSVLKHKYSAESLCCSAVMRYIVRQALLGTVTTRPKLYTREQLFSKNSCIVRGGSGTKRNSHGDWLFGGGVVSLTLDM